jgi:phenylalanyl-tRNA synthetase beta chain
MAAISAAAEPAVRDATLFDIFEPKGGAAGIAAGERSLAIRLEIRDDSRTLTDEEIDRARAAVVESLRQRLGVHLRQQ